MRDTMVHRGPDDGGLYLNGSIGLAHRRLSIVDISQAGHQPMTNEDGSKWIVYNGEIYNFKEIKKDLLEKGHAFRSNTDTEMIMHAYEEYGIDCVSKFRGMFAFAIWDEMTRELFLARDRLGIKPLYFCLEDDFCIFASEIKAILASKSVTPDFNKAILPNYLANRFVPGNETFYKGIHRLLPGTFCQVKDGKMKVKSYWDLDNPHFSFSCVHMAEDDMVAEFTSLFEESVRLRLMSDVPLGMLLSGGIDSSSICAMMSRMVDQPIETFSVGFEERKANEFHYARIVAKHFGTKHHEITIQYEDFFKALPLMIWHEDEPIAHASSIPLYFVAKLANEHVKVVLTGEGSDELLGGYYRYPKTLLNIKFGSIYEKVLPQCVRNGVTNFIMSLRATNKYADKLSRTFLARATALETIYFDNFATFSLHDLHDLFPDSKDSLQPYEEFKQISNHFSNNKDILDQLLYTDIKTYLVELLMKQDQMSMAASIESRVPFLDHKLVEFACSLPPYMKTRGTDTKYILRKAMQPFLPEEILKREKMGFPVPLDKWFRGSYKAGLEKLLFSDRFKKRKLMNQEKVKELFAAHQQGYRNNGDRLWLLANIELWYRIFIDGEEPEQVGKQL